MNALKVNTSWSVKTGKHEPNEDTKCEANKANERWNNYVYYAIGRLSNCECSDEDFLLTNLQHMVKYNPTITRLNGKYTAHAKTVQVFKLRLSTGIANAQKYLDVHKTEQIKYEKDI